MKSNFITKEDLITMRGCYIYLMFRTKKGRWAEHHGIETLPLAGDILKYKDGTRYRGFLSLRTYGIEWTAYRDNPTNRRENACLDIWRN